MQTHPLYFQLVVTFLLLNFLKIIDGIQLRRVKKKDSERESFRKEKENNPLGKTSRPRINLVVISFLFVLYSRSKTAKNLSPNQRTTTEWGRKGKFLRQATTQTGAPKREVPTQKSKQVVEKKFKLQQNKCNLQDHKIHDLPKLNKVEERKLSDRKPSILRRDSTIEDLEIDRVSIVLEELK